MNVNKINIISMLVVLAAPRLLFAEDGMAQVAPITVNASSLAQYERVLPEVSEEKLYSGKKTTSVEMASSPQITTNNYRQVFSQLPGLLTSEVANESFSSFSYRGIGDPHETFNMLVMQDGLALNSDPYGYPAVYFSPPVEAISSVEFVRGGAALLYGPLPGGAINYRSIQPSKELLSFSTKHVTGSRNLYSTFNTLSGTKGDTSYLGYFHHRHGDGFRTDNSDYAINNGNIKIAVDTSPDTTITFGVDVYNSDHGEAGGVSRMTDEQLQVAGAESGLTADMIARYDDDRFQSTRQHDRLRIERYMPTIRINHKISSDTSSQVTMWSGFLRRYSRRQAQGTAPSFGGIANGTTNDIVVQQFANYGFDSRVSHDWKLGAQDSTLTAGVLFNGIESPFVQQKGESVDSEAGAIQKKLNRRTFANSLFVENLFRITDDFRVTPGLRLESIYQDISETKNLAATPEVGLRSDSNYNLVPLLGLGMAYSLTSASEAYANLSQGYRPITYSDAIPLSVGDTISRDLDPTKVSTYEAGLRGRPESWLNFDTSVFMIDFSDQVGRVGTEIQNVGNSRHYGWDMSTSLGLSSLVDDLRGSDSDYANRLGEFSLYGNVSLLQADFTKGPVDGKTPQYAPKYMVRSGVIHTRKNLKLQFLGSFVGNHFGDDSNSDERQIPSYKVWDLLAEVPVVDTNASVVAGVNNIFDEDYFSRVRSTGIEAANPRNFYAGINIKF